MFNCVVCHFDAHIDDAVVIWADRHGICLACFDRETNNRHPMPKSLRRELASVLDEAETAGAS